MEQPADHTADVNVNVNRTGGTSRWQWISVVGVGTFLIVPVVFWMMRLISEVIPANTEAFIGVREALIMSKEQDEDSERALRANTRALNKVADKIGPDEEIE
jgi:hypothetical protein